MSKHQVKFEQFFAVPREKVFAYFSDHEKFGKVLGIRCRRIRDGADTRDVNGLGSVREIRMAGMKFEETITKFESPIVIEYQVTRGSPIKNHLGRLVFTDEPGGTHLTYTISFDPKIPGTGGLIAGILNTGWCKGRDRAVKAIAAA